MQRREAEIGLRDRKCRWRPKSQNDTDEYPRGNGLFYAGLEICGLVGLDGGVRSHMRTRLPVIAKNRVIFEKNRERNSAETGWAALPKQGKALVA